MAAGVLKTVFFLTTQTQSDGAYEYRFASLVPLYTVQGLIFELRSLTLCLRGCTLIASVIRKLHIDAEVPLP